MICRPFGATLATFSVSQIWGGLGILEIDRPKYKEFDLFLGEAAWPRLTGKGSIACQETVNDRTMWKQKFVIGRVDNV